MIASHNELKKREKSPISNVCTVQLPHRLKFRILFDQQKCDLLDLKKNNIWAKNNNFTHDLKPKLPLNGYVWKGN